MKTTKSCLAVIFTLIGGLLPLSGCSVNSVSYVEKSYDIPAADVQTVTIDVRDRKIEILESNDDQVHLKYFENEKEFYTIDYNGKKELSMVCDNNKEWDDYIGKKTDQQNRTIQVFIPESTLSNLNLKTSNEDLDLNSLTFPGSISASVNNGNIHMERLNAGTAITLDAKNGNINGTIVGSYDAFSIQSNVKKGKCNLPEKKETGSKRLTTFANNGDINIEFVE